MACLHGYRCCGGCFRPTKSRLATLQSKDDYECYAESYVKCFWNLCDQKSTSNFVRTDRGNVITTQPQRQQRPDNATFN